MIQLPLFAAPRPRRSYHPRTRPQAQDAPKAAAKTARQDDTILEWFLAHPGRYTASEVHSRAVPKRSIWTMEPCFDANENIVSARQYRGLGPEWPLTSTRRALTNWTKANPPRLRLTLDRRPGPFGAMEHAYELTTNQEQEKAS